MTEHVTQMKAVIAALSAACTALWGFTGWLVMLWFFCMLLDYVTGSLAAARQGLWSSRSARDGIWHKLGCIVAVTVGAVADLLLGLVTEHLPGLALGYSTLLCPMVVAWYTITELGSIMENALLLGAPVPGFLKKALALMKEKTEEE